MPGLSSSEAEDLEYARRLIENVQILPAWGWLYLGRIPRNRPGIASAAQDRQLLSRYLAV